MVSCAGRRSAFAPTVGLHQQFADIKLDLFPCFVDAMSSTPLAQRAVEKFYLKQGLVQAAARASSCAQGQVQVKNALRGRAGCHRARGARLLKCKPQDSSNARGGRRCTQTASSILRTSLKCTRRRLVGQGPRLYCRGRLLLSSAPIKYTHTGP